MREKANMNIVPLELHDFSQWLGCVIGILFGFTVQGNAQIYFVHLFEVMSKRTKIEYELNPNDHIDMWSIPALLFAGWGWTKKQVAEPAYFPATPIPRMLLPLSGPVANLALVGILGTFYIFLPVTVFAVAIVINIQIAVANLLIPIPPLALGRALCRPFDTLRDHQSSLEFVGAIVLGVATAAEYFLHLPLFDTWVKPISAAIFKWVVNQ